MAIFHAGHVNTVKLVSKEESIIYLPPVPVYILYTSRSVSVHIGILTLTTINFFVCTFYLIYTTTTTTTNITTTIITTITTTINTILLLLSLCYTVATIIRSVAGDRGRRRHCRHQSAKMSDSSSITMVSEIHRYYFLFRILCKFIA